MTYRIYLPVVAKAPAPLHPKRGVAWPAFGGYVPARFRGAGAGISWYHQWTPNAKIHPDGVAQVPMIWGFTAGPPGLQGMKAAPRTIWGAAQTLDISYSGDLLWLNEPQQHDQANIPAWKAAVAFQATRDTWAQARIIGPHLLIGMNGSPAMTFEAARYLREWVAVYRQMSGTLPDVQGIGFHNYISNPDQHISSNLQFMQAAQELFGTGIKFWVTEWGVFPQGGLDAEGAVNQIALWYDTHEAIEKHAYYLLAVPPAGDPWAEMALIDISGNPTPQGRGWGLR